MAKKKPEKKAAPKKAAPKKPPAKNAGRSALPIKKSGGKASKSEDEEE